MFSNSLTSTGLIKKEFAPFLYAVATSFKSVAALKTITGKFRCSGLARKKSKTSKPLILGSFKSKNRTTGNGNFWRSANVPSPL